MIVIEIGGVVIRVPDGATAVIRNDAEPMFEVRSDGHVKPLMPWEPGEMWINLERLHDLCRYDGCPLRPRRNGRDEQRP